MSLQVELANAFRKHIFEPLFVSGKWRVLVMDDRATHVLSSVFKMNEITELGVTLVESLYRVRKKFDLEAIYIMYPNRQELSYLVQDFSSDIPKYPAAHVFFLLSCPSDVLQMIASANCIRYIRTLKQLDMDFIPVESCVYTLDSPDLSKLVPIPPQLIPTDRTQLECLAERMATVLSTLNEYPNIVYRKAQCNSELARLIRSKLDVIKESNPSLGQGTHKDRSVLLIIDRGADPISPVLHELTLQAMCYDLLPVEDGMYTDEKKRSFNVTDQDPLWRELRHMNIGHIAKILPQRVHEFAESKKHFMKFQQSNRDPEGGYVNRASTAGSANELRELSNLLKQMPQYKTEAASYEAALSITSKCMQFIQQGNYRLCEYEQDLVMGKTGNGEEVKDPMRIITEALTHTESPENRLRLLMLFVLIKDGVSESHVQKLLAAAELPQSYKALFVSLCLITGAQFIQPDPLVSGEQSLEQLGIFRYLPAVKGSKVRHYLPIKKKRKDRFSPNQFTVSRWTPYLMDIMENIIQDKLDRTQFDMLRVVAPRASQSQLGEPRMSAGNVPSARFHTGSFLAPSSAGLGGRSPRSSPFLDRKAGGTADHCGPRLIVCVVGGATWSEIRCAYELTQKCIDARVAESDRHATHSRKASNDSAAGGSQILEGGGGMGWNWQVVIGGSHIINPKTYVEDLMHLSEPLFRGQTDPQAKAGQTTHRASVVNFAFGLKP